MTKYYPALDLFRFLAAIIVVVGHAHKLFGFNPVKSYLAVDLFFVMSGFVIAHSYEKRLNLGLGWIDFLKIRLIRLYPLYFIGFLLSLVNVYVSEASLIGHPELLLTIVPALFMLPSIPLGHDYFPYDYLYPLNLPAWSLLLELSGNILYVAVLPFFSKLVICLTLLFSASALILICEADSLHNLAVGWDRTTCLLGVARLVYSFSAGVLIYRISNNNRFEGLWHQIVVIIVALAFTMLFLPPPVWSGVWDILCVFFVYPFCVFFGARLTVDSAYQPVCYFLGSISYSIYIIHWPILNIYRHMAGKWAEGGFGPQQGFVFLFIVLALSILLDIIYDRPLRRKLNSSKHQASNPIKLVDANAKSGSL